MTEPQPSKPNELDAVITKVLYDFGEGKYNEKGLEIAKRKILAAVQQHPTTNPGKGEIPAIGVEAYGGRKKFDKALAAQALRDITEPPELPDSPTPDVKPTPFNTGNELVHQLHDWLNRYNGSTIVMSRSDWAVDLTELVEHLIANKRQLARQEFAEKLTERINASSVFSPLYANLVQDPALNDARNATTGMIDALLKETNK